ncbi:MAG: phosphatase PAP2 family protein [Gemmatimonadales bacterium]
MALAGRVGEQAGGRAEVHRDAPTDRSPAAARGFLPVDSLILGYIGVVSVVAVARWERLSYVPWVLAANLMIAGLILLVRRPGPGHVGRFLSELYPVFLLLALYGMLDLLNPPGGGRIHDQLVRGWEAAIFGGQVSRDWWRASPSGFWSTVFHASYWSYYIIVPLPAFWFAFRHDWRNARRTVRAVLTASILCYLCFIFFPVAGPYYEFTRPDAWFVANLPARMVYGTLANGSSFGAAFPSSHVAGTVAAALSAWMGSRRLGLALLVPTLLLTIGVVYTQMHYGVDALAGILVGVAGVMAWREGEVRSEK